MRVSSFFTFAFTLLMATQAFFGQSPYQYDVIATSSSALQVFQSPSINNNREIAFYGRTPSNGGVIFTDFLPNQPRAVATLGTTFFPSGQVQINDSRQILAQWSVFTTTPAQNYLAVIDGRADNLRTIIAAANGAGNFNDFNEIYPLGLTFNNNNQAVFQTRTGNNTTILTTGARPVFSSQTLQPSIGPALRPMVSDAYTIVFRNGNGGSGPIITLPGQNIMSIPTTIAQVSDGFTEIGQSPSISKNDEAIAFYGNLNAAGANTLGTNPGRGIFVSLKLSNGQRKIIRLAGRLVEDNPAPGGNDDGVCDLGETCISGELGFNQAGSPIFFNSFDMDSRIDVGYIESGKPGIDDDRVFVSFIGTPNIASNVNGQTFSNQKGLWTLEAKITADANGNFATEKPEKATVVAQVGDTISGNVVTDIAVYNQMANNKEKIAFYASSTSGNMIVRAVVFRTPIIFVPGVGGSELRNLAGTKLWSPESTSSDLTPLNINNDTRATDVIRKFKTGILGVVDLEDSIYTELLDSFKNNGYVEYNLDGDENRLNSVCGGQNITELQAKRPTLFVFPYDWRKTNGGNTTGVNADKLKKYIECIRAIYPASDVNIVAHSMGGLLSRNYILQNPGRVNHHVKNLITIGSPWLGAPRAIHAIETGSFIGAAFTDGISLSDRSRNQFSASFSNLLFSAQIKQIIEGFPGAHQLLPSPNYFALGGNPLRIDGVNYNFAQTRDWLNSRHPAFSPGTSGEVFHSFMDSNGNKQDDFRNDTTGVNYYHLYGRQVSNLTVGRIEPRKKALVFPLDGNVSIVDEIYPFATAGDGTVPIISSSRRTDNSDGLNATCGNAIDKRCIGVCYNNKAFDDDAQHNGMTKNPQVQSQIIQILKFADGLITQNSSFETTDCHLPPNNFSPQIQVESHYLTMTGIRSVGITDSQGNTNQSISTAYKLKVPGVLETIIGDNSMQIITPIDNTYTMRFTGNGQPAAIEDIRGVTNELSDATYIVRYNDFVIQNGVVAEIKIINNQVDSLKYDANGDGIPETVIPPSRVITNPPAADLEAPQSTVTWQKPRSYSRTVTINATDNASGVKRIYYKVANWTSFQTVDANTVLFSVSGIVNKTILVVTEDNAGNRSDVRSYLIPRF